MGDAKQLIVKPISAQDANRIIRQLHYSGKVVNNSQVHLGVFMDGKCGGAMQFGPSLDKRKIVGLVKGTLWNEFLELNRLAFADWLPRNGESRCIAYAMRFIKKTYPWMKWVISFADGTQCGDGTIYRASGFYLTGIKVNNQIWEAPSGKVFQSNSARGVSNCNLVKASAQKEALKTLPPATFSRTSKGGERERERAARVLSNQPLQTADQSGSKRTRSQSFDALGLRKNKGVMKEARKIISRTTTKGGHILETGASSMKLYKDAGWKPKAGYQLRYIYFLDPSARDRLTVPMLPFSEIERRGAGMYKGKPISRAASADSGTSGYQLERGGANPTAALQSSRAGSDTKDTPCHRQGEGGSTPTPALQSGKTCPPTASE